MRKKIKCDQHNTASPLYFFFKPIINNLKSFISGTLNVVFKIVFCSSIAASKTSFWARPLKIDHSKLISCVECSLEAHLEVFFLATFLKKRIWTLITTGKQLKVLKVRQVAVYALTVG